VSFGLAWVEDNPDESGLRAFIEPFVIILILVLNAAVGVWQESNAESALDALKEMQSDNARVIRGGQLVRAFGRHRECQRGSKSFPQAQLGHMQTALAFVVFLAVWESEGWRVICSGWGVSGAYAPLPCLVLAT
jgi:hypothetical protein